MTWEPRPIPNVKPEAEPFWEATNDGRLLLNECDHCEFVYYYPRAFCPDCFSDDVSWREASGYGTVYSYSVAPHVKGWPEEDLPLINSYIELEEGPRIISNIVDVAPEDVKVGMDVKVKFIETESEVSIPVFTSLE